MELRSTSAAMTRALGAEMARVLQVGDVVVLSGDLGAGKTVLTKGIASGLGVAEPVVSPTFTIVREYRDGRLPLFHLDVYRLGAVQEAIDLGIEEMFDTGVVVVEWGEGVRDVLGSDRLDVALTLAPPGEGTDDERRIRMAPVGESWLARAAELAAVVDSVVEAC